jgi:acetoin utilization deacetylase AcuC-like enzyme
MDRVGDPRDAASSERKGQRMPTAFFFDERCLWHSTGEHVIIAPVGGYVQPPSGTGHAENPETKRRLKNLVEVSGLGDRLNWRKAAPVSRADMERIHTPEYLNDFKALSNDRGSDKNFTPFRHGSFEIAALSAGLVKRAVSDVWHRHVENAYVVSRPPGHHCLPDAAMGFCFLANIPLALEALRAEVGPVRAAVVDWDVHHGNGTEACFYDRDDTLTISLHQENCFPPDTGHAADRGRGKGAGFNLNIPLLPGGGHQAYMDAFDLLVTPALRAFRPEIIVVASGLDASAFDPLARMLAHSETFRVMAGKIKALAEELCDGRLLAAHEGGYSDGYVPFCGLAVIETFAGHRTPVEDPFLTVLAGQQPPPDYISYQRQRLEVQAKSLGYL